MGFDEAFHKQSAINDELLQKKGTENAVKSSTIQRIHEKDRKNQRKLEIKIANLKDASAKRLAAKVKETESKSTLAKSEKLANAVSMKKEAFALVNSERSIKSGMGYDAKKKDDLHSMKTLKRNTYLAQDDYEQANMKEKDYYERNRKPKEIGGPYRLFPQRLDSYHRELRKREKTSLGIFAESDAKIRIKNQKKLKHVEIANKDTIARKKRLDEEMKQKEFANEQKRKKEGVTKIQEKTDLEEAKSRGKFDEAFHKQSAINDELLQKKGTENAVKSSTIQRIHEKDRKNQRKLEIKIANLKDAS